MNFKVFKTNEVEENTWREIADSFNSAFNRNNDPDGLKRYYLSNAFGFSYHCISYSPEGVISGYTAIVPFYYMMGDDQIIIGVGGGSFVKKEFRKDIFIFRDIWNCLRDYCLNEGIVAFFGVSNENSFKYSIEILNRTFLGYLKYFFLPLRPFNALRVKKLRWLDPVFSGLAYLFLLINLFCSFILKFKEKKSPNKIHLYDGFYNHRFHSGYNTITRHNSKSYYRLASEDGVRTAYLMDFREGGRRSYFSLTRSLLHIISHEQVDVVVYIGTLRMVQFAMIKMPKRMEPQKLPVIIDLLGVEDPSRYASLLDFSKWELGLMNFDMR